MRTRAQELARNFYVPADVFSVKLAPATRQKVLDTVTLKITNGIADAIGDMGTVDAE